MTQIITLLDSARNSREGFFDKDHTSAFRLFNGFLEGIPSISVDIYARTAVIHDYAPSLIENEISEVKAWIIKELPWVGCIIVKKRNERDPFQKKGKIIFGNQPDAEISENGVRYSIDLTMNRDASFYLDTRNLRTWAKDNLANKTILNTFAYTGSLGVAALVGGAKRVIQLDRNNSFLQIAKKSCSLNNFKVDPSDYIAQDFFTAIGKYKHTHQYFDCVFLDPPYFSSTSKGVVDLEKGNIRLLNKVRPLIKDKGWLISINNSLFVSGREYLISLETLCSDGYLTLEGIIPIATDFATAPENRLRSLPADPSPFNHSTKIAVLRVRRKN